MFPFQKGDLCFQISNNNNNNNNNNNEQLVIGDVNEAEMFNYNIHHGINNNNFATTNNNKRKYGSNKNSLAEQNNRNEFIINNNGDDDANKKMIHREIERQRRQEMATLYSSLRSILPLEYIKGKRATSDHIAEATKYIKDLEKNIKELGDQRELLKDTISSTSSNKLLLHGNNNNIRCSTTSSTSFALSRDDCNVNIHSFSNSIIEIEICTHGGVDDEHPFPFSRVLKVLNEEGLDVVSFVSSHVNDRLIYVTHCQVVDGSSIDSSQLKWRLYNEICS